MDYGNKPIMVIMGVGQSGSGKTYSLFGPGGSGSKSSSDDLDGIVMKLLKRYNASDINVLVGEIYEKSSDSYINYINGQVDNSTEFRYISKRNILKSLGNENKEGEEKKEKEIASFDKNNNKWILKGGGFELSNYLLEALKIRTIYPTPNNSESSRSHVIICIKFKTNEADKTFFIIDAAGVENKFKCETSEYMERFKKKLKSAIGTASEKKYMYGKYPNMRQAYSTNDSVPAPEGKTSLKELNNSFAGETEPEKIENLAKENKIECTIPDENLEVKVHNYVKDDRDKLKKKISILFASIFRWDYSNLNWKEYGTNLRGKRYILKAEIMEKDEKINYNEKFDNFQDLSFGDDDKQNQRKARKWLKNKIDKIKNQTIGDIESFKKNGIEIFDDFLHPENISLKMVVGVKLSSGKRFLHSKKFVLKGGEEELKFEFSAVKLFTYFIQNDLNPLKLNMSDIEDNKKKLLRQSIIGKLNNLDGNSMNQETYPESVLKNRNIKHFSGAENLFNSIDRFFWGTNGLYEIKPELTTDAICKKRAETIMVETCNKALVKQGKMINDTLAEFSNDMSKSSSTNLISKYLPMMLPNENFSKLEQLQYTRFEEKSNPTMYEDYIPKYFALSQNNSDSNFGNIVSKMHEINSVFDNNTSIEEFFEKINIYIILVMNITPIDFGGVEPNNPPQPPYINLELLKKAINKIKSQTIQIDKFIKILAFTLYQIFKYDDYKESQSIMDMMEFFKLNKDNLNDETLNKLIEKIKEIIGMIEKNNAATLIGNTVEMHKHINIMPMLYTMSEKKQNILDNGGKEGEPSAFDDDWIVGKYEEIKILKEDRERKKREEEKAKAAAAAAAKAAEKKLYEKLTKTIKKFQKSNISLITNFRKKNELATGDLNTYTDKVIRWVQQDLNPAIESVIMEKKEDKYVSSAGRYGKTGIESRINLLSKGNYTKIKYPSRDKIVEFILNQKGGGKKGKTRRHKNKKTKRKTRRKTRRKK